MLYYVIKYKILTIHSYFKKKTALDEAFQIQTNNIFFL